MGFLTRRWGGRRVEGKEGGEGRGLGTGFVLLTRHSLLLLNTSLGINADDPTENDLGEICAKFLKRIEIGEQGMIVVDTALNNIDQRLLRSSYTNYDPKNIGNANVEY